MKRILIMSLLSVILSFLGCAKSKPDDKWTVATGRYNGKPMIVRFRSAIPSGVNIKQYPYLMVISWKYESADQNGMPSKSDYDRMVLLENLLESIETKQTAFLTVSVTCNGVKEWQWYSRDQKEAMAALNSALSGQNPFPIQISQQQDPEWSAYFRFKNN
jgi:Family of unknown function (DUF695)